MKHFLAIILFILCSNAIQAQTPCTLILNNNLVIDAYHVGNIKKCKKKKRKESDELIGITIQGIKDGAEITVADFSDISEVKFSNFVSISTQSQTYTVDAKIIYNNGTEENITKASIGCSFDDDPVAIVYIPIHITNNDSSIIKKEIHLKNITTLIF